MTETKTKQTWNKYEAEVNANFYGTQHWYRVSPFTDLTITDGVKHLADTFSCYWLLDEINLNIYRVMKANNITFAIITIDVDKNNEVIVTAKEDTEEPIFAKTERIKDVCKELPIGTHELWLEFNVLLEKSER